MSDWSALLAEMETALLAALWCLTFCLIFDALVIERMLDDPDTTQLWLHWLSGTFTAGFGFCLAAMCAHLYATCRSATPESVHAICAVAVVPTVAALLAVLIGASTAVPLLAMQPLAVCAVALVLVQRLMRSYRDRGVASRLDALGIRITLLSAGCAWLWLLARTVTGIHGQLPHESELLRLLAAILVGCGFSLPLLNTVYRRRRTRRLCRRLTRLWEVFDDDLGQLHLASSDKQDPNELLYRRVIEIRDAQRLLRRYLPARLSLAPESLADRLQIDLARAGVVSEASSIIIALDAYRSGQDRTPHQPYSNQRQFPTVHEEGRWLANVADAVHSDPLVAHLRTQAAQATTGA